MPVVVSIFKLSQQWGIVFPINIAFWLFTHGQMTPYPAEGAADSDIAPKSTLRCNQATLWCPIPPVLWWEVQALYQRCALLPALLAQLCLQTSWGREGVRVKLSPEGREATQHSLEGQVIPLHSNSNISQPRKALVSVSLFSEYHVALLKIIVEIIIKKLLVAGV